MKSIYLFCAASVLSMSAFASGVQTPLNADGQRAIYFLSQYCVDALSKAAATGAWIGNTSYSGDWNSGAVPFTISYAMFRQVGFVESESAGTIELKATPVANPPADGSSLDITCTYQ